MLHECQRSRRPAPPRRACSVGRIGAPRCSPAICGSIPPPRPGTSVSVDPRSATSWVPSSWLSPAPRPRPKRRWCLRRAARGVLVDDDERGALLAVLALVADRDEILDDRGPEHRRRQRSPVGLEPEEDDVAAVERFAEIDDVLAGCWIERCPTSDSARIASRSRAPARSRSCCGVNVSRYASSGRASAGLILRVSDAEPSAVHVLDDRREADRHAGQPQCADYVADVALREPLVVRLGEDLRREQLVRDLGVRPPFVRVVDRHCRADPIGGTAGLRGPLPSRSCSRTKSSPFGSI